MSPIGLSSVPFWPWIPKASDPLNQVWSLGWRMNAAVATATVYMGGSMGIYGGPGEIQRMDEQPEEEHPWWNIVLAE